jgi:2-polyprenyl-6-methoxyphenol hydroxylase-like FAD-dependent oxidoreductase
LVYNHFVMKVEVIIVGAGPTGLALACQLIRFGIDFLIVDKNETTSAHSKAIGVQARTLEIYEQIGLADKLIARGALAEKARFIEGGIVRGEASLKDIGTGMSSYPFLLLVDQSDHESLLYDHIRAHGKDVTWNTELVDVSQTDAGVSAVFTDSSGGSKTVDARFLVACDGSKSVVRHKLGIDFSGTTFERLFYVADVQIDWEFGHDAVVVNLGENNLAAFFPMIGDKRFRIVGTFPEGHNADEGEILYEEIEGQIETDLGMKLDISHVNWFSVYKVHSRAVEKFFEKNIFLAGDSAHIHTPVGAQGMNTGIQDGYNLAWKLALVIKENAPAALLETYNDERLENAHRLLQTTDRFFQLGTSPEWFVAFFRTHIFPHLVNVALSLDVVKRAIFPLVSQIGINYRRSTLSRGTKDLAVRAGDRMPYFELNGSSIFDQLREPRFHCLIFETDGSENLDQPSTFPKGKFGGLVETMTIPLTETVMDLFGTNETFTMVLRPDNHIGLIAEGTAGAEVERYIGEILGSN